MIVFGDRLRQAREARGLSLDAVASATRIAKRHLAALERGDLESLPRGPFGKGYVRAYAEFLGIESGPIIQAYRSQEGQRGLSSSATQRRTLEELSQLVQRRSEPRRTLRWAGRRTWAFVTAAVLVILGVAGWLLVGDSPPEERPQRRSAPAKRSAAEAAATADAGETRGTLEARPRPTPALARDGAAATSSTELRVSDSGVGIDVRRNQLVGRTDRILAGTSAAFWTRVLGGRPGDVIHHFWMHDGRVAMRADLTLGGPHWRTHSRLVLPEDSTGLWVAEARDRDGRVLAREEFLCISPGP